MLIFSEPTPQVLMAASNPPCPLRILRTSLENNEFVNRAFWSCADGCLKGLSQGVWLATLFQSVRGSTAEQHELVTLEKGMICQKIEKPGTDNFMMIFVLLIALGAFLAGCWVGAKCCRPRQEPPQVLIADRPGQARPSSSADCREVSLTPTERWTGLIHRFLRIQRLKRLWGHLGHFLRDIKSAAKQG